MVPESPHKARREKLLALAVWLVVWQLAAWWIGQKILLVGPVETLGILFSLLPKPGFWARVGHSVVRILGGYLLAVVLGVVLAVASAASRTARRLIAVPMQTIKAAPVASFIILALFWVSSRWLALLISLLIGLPVVYTAVLQGIRSTDRQLLEMARVFRLPFGRTLRAVWLPQILPFFAQSCRTALGLCVKSGVAAEVIGLPGGSIGEALYGAKISLLTGELFAWTLVIICISALAEKLLGLLLDALSARFGWEGGAAS